MDETYYGILRAIPLEHKRYATIILQLITFSQRPVTIEEAVDAIAVRTDKQPYFSPKYRMPDPREISRYCSSLVTVVSVTKGSHGKVESRMELQLAHFSVKEYLLSDGLDGNIRRGFQERCARAAIAKVCLAYLLHFDEKSLQTDILQCYPFAVYSVSYWLINAARAKDTDNEMLQLIEKFFHSSKGAYKVCYDLHRPDQPCQGPYEARDLVAPALYYVALEVLLHTVECLLNQGVDVNAQGGVYGNALCAASYGGHELIARLLVEKGADFNAQDGTHGNALYPASSRGHEQIVRLLMEKSADVNAQGGVYGNALQAVSSRGHEQIVRLLVEKGADVNAQGGEYEKTLPATSSGGREQIVRLLVEKGADVNAQGGEYGNALYAASSRDHEMIVRLLMEKGADVNAQGRLHGNALHAASSGGTV